MRTGNAVLYGFQEEAVAYADTVADDARMQFDGAPMVKPATTWLRGLLRAGKAQQRTARKLAKVLFS
ncbi:MAG: hypothetical protein RLZZ237_997, partial [Pseudomonadota bacterium]